MTGIPIRDRIEELFFRVAASGTVPNRFFARVPPRGNGGGSPQSAYDLEIVSHCWRYGRLLTYQLSSLVLHPPARSRVRMTVFYCREDTKTFELLRFFGRQRVRNVTWNWCSQERTHLCRRAIGRNLAAKATRAAWIWFTDCDVTFQEGGLDALSGELEGCRSLLAFPKEHQVSEMLEPDDPLFTAASGAPSILDVDLARFRPEQRTKAVGGFQIVPGDVARAVGYCEQIGLFQRPASGFGRTWEDRTFRWLLGTRGTPLATSEFYRIRHTAKGRYGNELP